MELHEDLLQRLKNARSIEEILANFPKDIIEYPKFYDALGRILMDKIFFYQAHLLFDQGLAAQVQESEDEFLNPNLHRRFHFDLSDLIFRITRDPNSRILDFGFPVKKLGFHYSAELGFYLLDFDYNQLNSDQEHVSISEAKDRTLGHIHTYLGILCHIRDAKVHNSQNCPYLEYIGKK